MLFFHESGIGHVENAIQYLLCLSYIYLLGCQGIFSQKKLNLGYPRTSKDIYGNLKKTKVIPEISYTINLISFQPHSDSLCSSRLRDLRALLLLLSWVAWPCLAPFCITAIRHSAVFSTDRPPRRGLPRLRLSSHSRWFNSYDVAPLPTGVFGGVCTFGSLLKLWQCLTVGIELPWRNEGIKGTRPRTTRSKSLSKMMFIIQSDPIDSD